MKIKVKIIIVHEIGDKGTIEHFPECGSRSSRRGSRSRRSFYSSLSYFRKIRASNFGPEQNANALVYLLQQNIMPRNQLPQKLKTSLFYVSFREIVIMLQLHSIRREIIAKAQGMMATTDGVKMNLFR